MIRNPTGGRKPVDCIHCTRPNGFDCFFFFFGGGGGGRGGSRKFVHVSAKVTATKHCNTVLFPPLCFPCRVPKAHKKPRVLRCVRLTVFRNRNTCNRSSKSFVFAEIHIKIVEHPLKCYFKHSIFIILVNLLPNAKHDVLNHHSTYSYVFLFRDSVNRKHSKVVFYWDQPFLVGWVGWVF